MFLSISLHFLLHELGFANPGSGVGKRFIFYISFYSKTRVFFLEIVILCAFEKSRAVCPRKSLGLISVR